MIVEISTKVYEEMKITPLFFVKFNKGEIYTDEKGRVHDSSTWNSFNYDFSIRCPAEEFGNTANGYCLCLVENATYVVKKKLKRKYS